jgi:hypothetical protein
MERWRELVSALVAVLALTLAAGPAWPVEGTTGVMQDTTGKVSIESKSVGAGLGYAWGNGVLEYRGQQYPFTVKGFSILDVGVSKVVASGEVYNLKDVEDFEGIFMAAVAGGTFGGGAGAAAMQNQHDVKLVWTATSQGLSLSLAQAGLSMKLTPEAHQQAARNRRNAEGQPAAAPRTSP